MDYFYHGAKYVTSQLWMWTVGRLTSNKTKKVLDKPVDRAS